MKDYTAHSENLQHLADALGELSVKARDHGHTFLAYLIDMASAEAVNLKASADYEALTHQARNAECPCP